MKRHRGTQLINEKKENENVKKKLSPLPLLPSKETKPAHLSKSHDHVMGYNRMI
jgi:hypothetical protein